MTGTCTSLLILAGLVPLGQEGTCIKDITWRLGAAFPELRKGCSLGVFEGKPISAGGMRHPWQESARTCQYDPEKNQWIDLPALPKGRVYMDGVSLGDAFYVVGGRREGQTLSEVTRLTRIEGQRRWTEMPPLAVDCGFMAMDTWKTHIVVAGGNRFRKGQDAFTDKTTIGVVQMFDTARAQEGWSRLPDIPGPSRGWVACAVVRDALYLFGGAYFRMVEGKRQTVHLRETLRMDLQSHSWQRRADLPFGLSGHDAVAFADRYVILLGGAPEWSPQEEKSYGRVPGEYSARVLVYDTQGDRFEMLPTPMPHGVNDIRAVCIGRTIYALGGENIEKETSNTTNHLRIGTIVP